MRLLLLFYDWIIADSWESWLSFTDLYLLSIINPLQFMVLRMLNQIDSPRSIAIGFFKGSTIFSKVILDCYGVVISSFNKLWDRVVLCSGIGLPLILALDVKSLFIDYMHTKCLSFGHTE